MSEFFKSIFLAVKLDLFDINYIFGSERFHDILDLYPEETLPRSGVWIRCFLFIAILLKNMKKSLISIIGIRRRLPLDNSIQMFVITNNQRDALLPIKEKLADSFFVGHDVFVDYEYPIGLSYLLSLPFLPIVIWRMMQSSGFRRKYFRYFFDHYWLIYGYYLAARIWLKKTNPKAIIMANDHSFQNRIILKVAKEYNILTFYLQHASVTDKFPPLAFDFALLDGMDALEKYNCSGLTKTKVFLIGICKFDKYYNDINYHRMVKTLGICASNIDRVSSIERLCKKIKMAFPSLHIILRPHPGDSRYDEWIRISALYEMDFSDARKEMPFDFLKKIDVIIAGDSNILLEAAVMNIYPMYYDISQKRADYYGFIKNGLTQYFLEPEDVCKTIHKILNNKPYIRNKAKYYCNAIDTEFDGHSSHLSCSLIASILNKETMVMAKWKPIPCIHTEAYELVARKHI